MTTYVSAELRRLVQSRANHLCEYCFIHEEDTYIGCQVDHVIAEKHGGTTDPDNLGYACAVCNRAKGTDIGSIAPSTGVSVNSEAKDCVLWWPRCATKPENHDAGLPTEYEGRPSNHPLGAWSSRIPRDQHDNAGSGWRHHEKGAGHWFYSCMEINRRNARGIYSFHTGAYVAMCDGSVHFKAEGTHPEIMVALFSRDEGVEEQMRLSRLVDQIPK